MVSAADDYPIHQIAEFIRHVGTGDRNFYDRYYFNLHACSDELMMVMGMGQYPNLATQDAFVVVRRGDKHRVVRASRELGDRMDTSVGPFRVEVIEGLKKVRFVLEPNDHDISFDLMWEGAMPAHEEPRHFSRAYGREVMNTSRFAQTGCWTGTLTIAGETFEVTPDHWWGTRDRSWGVRPVGEPEPPGIRATAARGGGGMWNYAPMQFNDYSILYICQEDRAGKRTLEEATRIWADPDREPEHLGRPEHAHEFESGTRWIKASTLSFPQAPGGPIEVRVTPLTHVFVGIGTGYGFDQDWRHGMYQGELVVQGLTLDMNEDKDKLFGLTDQMARFELGDDVGYGLHEYSLMGAHDKYGFKSFDDVAP